MSILFEVFLFIIAFIIGHNTTFTKKPKDSPEFHYHDKVKVLNYFFKDCTGPVYETNENHEYKVNILECPGETGLDKDVLFPGSSLQLVKPTK